MNNQHGFRKKLLAEVILSSLLATGANLSFGQSAVDLGTVQTSAGGESGAATNIKSAPHQAPSQGSLTAVEPASVINQHYIQENASSGANYNDIISISPSVSDVDPNGPGLMESQGLSIRGFQDGEFNVTFDGIPWGDSNDFTHHSTSYFMPQDLGQIQVNRGPGTAATIGDATFGGTVNVSSKNPQAQAALTPYLSTGSFNTHLEGLQFDTGTLQNYDDASAFLDYKQVSSDGYLKNAHQRRKNLFGKLIKPVGENTLLTFAAMYQDLHQNVPIGATKAQIDQYGYNFALSSDPNSQAYAGYNYDKITTDFEYFGIKTQLQGWNIDNKLYTYSYDHKGFNGADPNGETPNGTIYGADNVPGQKMAMVYRSVGDVLRLSHNIGPGTLNFGIWGDHQKNTRWQYEIDFTNGGAYNGATPADYTDRNMRNTLTTIQPYAEYDWKVTDQLTVTPGVKYIHFRRSLNAEVNQKTGAPLSYSKTWNKALPSLTVHYAIEPNWTSYVQWAKGFLAPNLNTFYTADPSASDVKPEETTNTQIGTTWKHERLSLSGDLYYIDFNNKVEHRTVAANTIFYNAGGAIYKGLETEATYYVGSGFSLYGNFSANSAKEKDTHQWMPNAPKNTAAAGVIYNDAGYYASLLDKYVGHRYGDSGETEPLGSYSVTNFALSYTLANEPGMFQHAKVGFQVNNLFNKKSIYALAGYTGGANTPLYWTLPKRSYQVSLSVSF